MSCICKINSGPNKGKKCGKPVKDGRFCRIHKQSGGLFQQSQTPQYQL